jgi:hypothetical protein
MQDGSQSYKNPTLSGSKNAMDRVQTCQELINESSWLLWKGNHLRFEGISTETLSIWLVLDNCASHPHLDPLKSVQLEFIAPLHNIPGTANEHENHNKYEDLVYCTNWIIRSSKQFKKIYWQHLQQTMRSLQGLMF